MKKTENLANRLREVLINGKWIANTNFKDQISNLNWEQATKRIADLNTIASLVFHINYYLTGVQHFFDHCKLEIKDQYSFELPEIKCESDWNALVNDFLINAEKFANTIEKMDENLLDQPFVDEKYGNYWRNIEAVIEHSYYHLGQVSLLRKMITKQ